MYEREEVLVKSLQSPQRDYIFANSSRSVTSDPVCKLCRHGKRGVCETEIEKQSPVLAMAGRKLGIFCIVMLNICNLVNLTSRVLVSQLPDSRVGQTRVYNFIASNPALQFVIVQAQV
jgi:hypothetical protein